MPSIAFHKYYDDRFRPEPWALEQSALLRSGVTPLNPPSARGEAGNGLLHENRLCSSALSHLNLRVRYGISRGRRPADWSHR